MLTSWVHTPRSEAERLVLCAHQIVVGFYKINKFVILPENPGKGNFHSVVFPDVPYSSIPRFWNQVKNIDVGVFPYKISDKLLSSVTKLIDGKLPVPQYQAIKTLWEKSEKCILDEIYKVLPSKKNLIKKIIIHPTTIGTSSSFDYSPSTGVIVIYLRDDQGIHSIVESIITSITRADIYANLDGLWSESEIITDFLVTSTSISRVVHQFEPAARYMPTIKGIRPKEFQKLAEQSRQYYKKLGLLHSQSPFSCHQGIPKIFNKTIEGITASEKKLAVTLIANQNQLTDFDTIGAVLFDSEEKFSLYAISKTIQRLRDKFESNGISGSYIQTQRAKGYVLKTI